MKDTRLATLLDTLDKQEIKLLKKWIASPFFNQRQDVIDLFQYYLDYKKKHLAIPSKKTVFEYLFPNQQYDDHKVRLVMSFLKRLTEQFLVHQENEKHKIKQQLLLAKIYRQRKLEKQAKQNLKAIPKMVNAADNRGADYHDLSYQYYAEKLEHEKKEDRTRPKSIQQIMDHLDAYYIIQKLMFATRSIAIENYTNIKYDLGLLTYLMPAIANSPFVKNDAVITSFCNAYDVSLANVNEISYEKLKGFLFQYSHLCSTQELDYLLAIASGYCTIAVNKGNRTKIKDLQELYEFALEQSIFTDFTHHSFKNIVNTGLSNRKLDWVENFINDYGPHLDEAYRLPMVNMAKANLAYFRGQYDSALELIRGTKFDDVFHEINAKIIVIKSLYELQESEVLQSQLKAFTVFIRRHSAIGYKKELYFNFASFLKKIINLNPYDKAAKKNLREEMASNQRILHVRWLRTLLDD